MPERYPERIKKVTRLKKQYGLLEDEVPILDAVYKTPVPKDIKKEEAEKLKDRIARQVARRIQKIQR